MKISDIVFEKSKIDTLKEAINDLCLNCSGIGALCSECEVEQAKHSKNINLNTKNFEILTDNTELDFSKISFDKNRILLTQNAIEEVCTECPGAGILCFDCEIHQLRRTVASLAVIDNTPKFDNKGVKKSGGSCGTSCSTGCKPKK